jgi:hypothetical protein
MQNMNPVLLGSNEPNPFVPQPPPGAKIYRDLFTYEVPSFDLLAVGAAVTNQVLIQNDSDFEWIAAAYEFDLAATTYVNAAQNVPNMTILIVDTGSGRQLMNAAVPVIALFGQLGQPYTLPISKVFGRNSSIQFTATNIDAAVTTGHLRLSLIGWKIFYYN